MLQILELSSHQASLLGGCVRPLNLSTRAEVHQLKTGTISDGYSYNLTTFQLIPMFCKLFLIATRGPRGPWVAHLRKRSQATVEPIIENPRPRSII